jgi:hypothetical protein
MVVDVMNRVGSISKQLASGTHRSTYNCCSGYHRYVDSFINSTLMNLKQTVLLLYAVEGAMVVVSFLDRELDFQQMPSGRLP